MFRLRVGRGEAFIWSFPNPNFGKEARMKKRECEKNLGQEETGMFEDQTERSTRRVSKMSQRAERAGSRYTASDTLGWNVHNGKPRRI